MIFRINKGRKTQKSTLLQSSATNSSTKSAAQSPPSAPPPKSGRSKFIRIVVDKMIKGQEGVRKRIKQLHEVGKAITKNRKNPAGGGIEFEKIKDTDAFILNEMLDTFDPYLVDHFITYIHDKEDHRIKEKFEASRIQSDLEPLYTFFMEKKEQRVYGVPQSARFGFLRRIMDKMMKGQQEQRNRIAKEKEEGTISKKTAFILGEMLDKFSPASVEQFLNEGWQNKSDREIKALLDKKSSLSPLGQFFLAQRIKWVGEAVFQWIDQHKALSHEDQEAYRRLAYKGLKVEDFNMSAQEIRDKMGILEESGNMREAYESLLFLKVGPKERAYLDDVRGKGLRINGEEAGLKAARKEDAEHDLAAYVPNYTSTMGEVMQDVFVEIISERPSRESLQGVYDVYQDMSRLFEENALDEETQQRLNKFEAKYPIRFEQLRTAYHRDMEKEMERAWREELETREEFSPDGTRRLHIYNKIPPVAFWGTPLAEGGYIGAHLAKDLSHLEGGMSFNDPQQGDVFSVRKGSPLDQALRERNVTHIGPEKTYKIEEWDNRDGWIQIIRKTSTRCLIPVLFVPTNLLRLLVDLKSRIHKELGSACILKRHYFPYIWRRGAIHRQRKRKKLPGIIPMLYYHGRQKYKAARTLWDVFEDPL